MIVDINGVPHYVRGGKLYPAGSTPPPDPRDGAPRVIANCIDGGGAIICLILTGCPPPLARGHHHCPRCPLLCSMR